MSTAPENEQEKSRPPPNRRRDKPQLSCNLCRRLKSVTIRQRCRRVLTLWRCRRKCDRRHPCGLCKARGVAPHCTFVATDQPTESPELQSALPAPSDESVHDAVCQLEQMISQLQIPSGEAEKMVAILAKVRYWHCCGLNLRALTLTRRADLPAEDPRSIARHCERPKKTTDGYRRSG